MSLDARYIVFSSTATNLVGDDTNGAADVFVRDLVAGKTRRAPGEYHVRGHSPGPRGKLDPFQGDLSITVAPQDEHREWHVVLQRDRR